MTTVQRGGTRSGSAGRYWEMDALRGVAISMMLVYHTAFDLVFFCYYGGDVYAGGWRLLQLTTVWLFLLLVGISLTISYARSYKADGHRPPYKRYLLRGPKLLGLGMVVAVAVLIYLGKPLVIFGILHLIGASVILSYPLLWRRRASLVLGLAVIALGIYVGRQPVSFVWLLPLGLHPAEFLQLDWYPLLPWFGVVLLGSFAGQTLCPGGRRHFAPPDRGGYPVVRQLAWLGRHSLAIYLVHQPLLFGLAKIVAT